MNFNEYETGGHALYGELSRLIRGSLEDAVDNLDGIPPPQSIQHRRKTPASARAKLIQREALDSPAIEKDIKDLAGVRLIFYGQDDVDSFIQARMISKLFAVQWEETKVHYPILENAKQRYTAIHYIVSLNGEMTAKPEYTKFAGLRCEIQIQTLLDHAYAETYHDLVYKTRGSAGFGTAQRVEFDRRMQHIMDTYLRPAGYELDKVRRDHHQLMRGKMLFDRGILGALEQAKDNNERRELLDALLKDVVPNYDDIADVYSDIRRSVIKAVRAAREAVPVSRGSDFGALNRMTAVDVTRSALTLLDTLRYVDIAGTLDALIDIYSDEPCADVSKRTLEVVHNLAENNIDTWYKVGPGAQAELARRLEDLSDDQVNRLHSLVLTGWRALLSPDVEGLKVTSDAVLLHKGTVQVSDQLKDVRQKAVTGLVRLIDSAQTDARRDEAASALGMATAMPSQMEYDGALASVILENMVAVFVALRERIATFSYDMLQSLEQQIFYDYELARELGAVEHLECQTQAETARDAALGFRDALNADDMFVRYKILIGIDTVVPQQWEDDDFDWDKAEDFRRAEAEKYLAAITEQTLDAWRPLLVRCAAADTNDGAATTLFGNLVRELARTKPKTALRLLEEPTLLRYLPGILNGLAEAGDLNLYRALFVSYLSRGEQLSALAIHLQATETPRLTDASALLQKAITIKDTVAIGQCIALAFQWHAADMAFCIERLLIPATDFAIANRVPHLLYQGWFLREAKELLPQLTDAQADLLLQSQLPLPRIDHRLERMIGLIAEKHPKQVWEFFKARLEAKGEVAQYQAVPYQLHSLAIALSKDSDLAVNTVRSWFKPDDRRFRYSGGRLLHAVFRTFTPALAQSLQKLIAQDDAGNIAFVIHVLQNYRGDESTLPTIRGVIRALPAEDPLLSGIYACLGSTGVVAGEFGLVESERQKKTAIEAWGEGGDPKVQAFAKRYTRELEQEIAAEQRRVEQSRAMRRLDYGEDIVG